MDATMMPEIIEQEFGVSKTGELLNWSKSQIEERALAIVDSVAQGLADPLQEYLKVRKAQELFGSAEKNLKPYMDGLTLNKGEMYFGCEIVEKETGVSFDYTVCNDPQWNDLNNKLISLKAEMKEREAFLKGVKSPMELVNTDTGETYTLNPPVKSGKMGKAVTIK